MFSWFAGKKEKSAPEEVQAETQEVQEQPYKRDTGQDPKDFFNTQRDRVLLDERYLKASGEEKRNILGRFYDVYGTSYLKQAGIDDPNVATKYRDMFIDDAIEVSKIATLPEKKSDSEALSATDPEAKPDWLNDLKYTYKAPSAERDATLSTVTVFDPVAAEQVRKTQENFANSLPELYNTVTSTEGFKYISDNPERFLQEEERAAKDLDKELREKYNLPYHQRVAALNYFEQSVQEKFVNNLRDKVFDWDKLNAEVKAFAAPYTEKYEEGTFLDPVTGERRNDPKTEDEANYAALKEKYGAELALSVVTGGGSNAVSEAMRAFEQEYKEFNIEMESLKNRSDYFVKTLEERGFLTNEDLERDPTLLSEEKDFQNRYQDFQSRYQKFDEGLAKEVNKNINTEDPTTRQRLENYLTDAYLEIKHWQSRLDSAKRQLSGEEPALSREGLPNVIKESNVRLTEAKARFEAASQMLHNNRGMLDVERDQKYLWEVFGKSWLTHWSEYLAKNEVVQQDVMNKMIQISQKIGVVFTDDEKNYIEDRVLENFYSASGSLPPVMLDILLLQGAVGGLMRIPTKGVQVIRNPALNVGKTKEGIGLLSEGAKRGRWSGALFSDATSAPRVTAPTLKQVVPIGSELPIGWEIVKQFPATKMQQAQAMLYNAVAGEIAFQSLGFELGAATGFSLAHQIRPKIKFNGRLQVLNPFVTSFIGGAVGPTIGMQGGKIGGGLGAAMLTDKPIRTIFDELFPGVEETSKQIAAEMAMNGMFFGTFGMLTTSMQKQVTAPVGAKYDRFGEANYFSYFNPVYRNRVYNAANEFQKKGFHDTAKYLYDWLDVTKNLTSAKQMKDARMANYEKAFDVQPVSSLMYQQQLHKSAIRVLELQSRDPNFQGKLKLDLGEYKNMKKGRVVAVVDKIIDPKTNKPVDVVTYWEITKRKNAPGEKNKPIEFEAVNPETGQKRIFKRDADGSFPGITGVGIYELKSPLEIPARLEHHYEILNVIDRVIHKKGRSVTFPGLEPGPKPLPSLPVGTGEVYIKPPIPTKLKQRIEAEQARLAKLQEETPYKAPEDRIPLQEIKKFSYGRPEEILSKKGTEIPEMLADKQVNLEQRLSQLEAEKVRIQEEIGGFKGFLDLHQRKKKQELQNSLRIIDSEIELANLNFQKEFGEYFNAATPYILGEIKNILPETTPEQEELILDEVYQIMVSPQGVEYDLTVKQQIALAANRVTGIDVKPGMPSESLKEPTELPKPEEKVQKEDTVDKMPDGEKPEGPDAERDRIIKERDKQLSDLEKTKDPGELVAEAFEKGYISEKEYEQYKKKPHNPKAGPQDFLELIDYTLFEKEAFKKSGDEDFARRVLIARGNNTIEGYRKIILANAESELRALDKKQKSQLPKKEEKAVLAEKPEGEGWVWYPEGDVIPTGSEVRTNISGDAKGSWARPITKEGKPETDEDFALALMKKNPEGMNYPGHLALIKDSDYEKILIDIRKKRITVQEWFDFADMLLNEGYGWAKDIIPLLKEKIAKKLADIDEESVSVDQPTTRKDVDKDVSLLIDNISQIQITKPINEFSLRPMEVTLLDKIVLSLYPIDVEMPIIPQTYVDKRGAEMAGAHMLNVIDFAKLELEAVNDRSDLDVFGKKNLADKWERILDWAERRYEDWESYIETQFGERADPPGPSNKELTSGEKIRAAGVVVVNGVKYHRQVPIVNIAYGSSLDVAFGQKVSAVAKYAIIERANLQPSHKSGYENPMHFIPEAQPRNRGNLNSLADAAKSKAQDLQPQLLGISYDAYTGAPIVNERGEVIQGSGRAEAIDYYYSTTVRDPQGYKDHLKLISSFTGIDPIKIDQFGEPVLVRVVEVSDQDAIKLGNYRMKDLEDVSEESSNIKVASNRLSPEQGVVISNVVLRNNDVNDTLNDLIRKNAQPLIDLLTQYDIFSQGDAEKFVKSGVITPEGIKAVEAVIKGLFFKGGNENLPEVFERLPYTLRRGLEKSIPVLLRLTEEGNILPSLRNAMMAMAEYDEFYSATGMVAHNIKEWTNQTNMFTEGPRERYTPFELALVDVLWDPKNQSVVVNKFLEYEEMVKGKPADLFGPEAPGIKREIATKEVFGEPYKKTIDDEYEKETTVSSEPLDKKPDQEPAAREGGQAETIVQKEDIGKELKNMEDLLGDIDWDTGGVQAMGGQGELDVRTKMLNAATGVVKKLVESGNYDYSQLLSKILPQLERHKLEKMLPFFKQAYLNIYDAIKDPEIKSRFTALKASSFTETDLDQLIADLNKPTGPDTYADVIGKRFFNPAINKEFEVLRIEVWRDQRDQKFEMMGGIWSDLPSEFKNVEVAIISDEKISGQPKRGVSLSNLREAIHKGNVKEIPPFQDEYYSKGMEEVRQIYLEIGDVVKAEQIERLKKYDPNGKMLPKTTKEAVEIHKRMAVAQKYEHDLMAGKYMPPPVVVDKPFTLENLYENIDLMHSGDKGIYAPYITSLVPKETLDELVRMRNEAMGIMAKLGFASELVKENRYLWNKASGIGVAGSLYRLAKLQSRQEKGDERVTTEKLEQAKKDVLEDIKRQKQKLDDLRSWAYALSVKNAIWNKRDLGTWASLKSLADQFGLYDRTVIREATELAMIDVAKKIMANANLSGQERFTQIYNFYMRMPALSYRTGDIKEMAQYSTPPPIAAVMNMYVNAEVADHVLDPTAGNGGLLIGARKTSVRANEIDPVRKKNLTMQGYNTMSQDITKGIVGIFDVNRFPAILMNHPFIKHAATVNGYPLINEDALTAETLQLLDDHGKAAIITGNHIKFDDKGRMIGADLRFFNWLNHYYHVEDIIHIPGDFYAKMGTSYPVKLILVNGRKAVPDGAAPLYSEKFEPVKTWNEFFERVQQIITKPNEKSVLQGKLDANRGDGKVVVSPPAPKLPPPNTPGSISPVPGEGQAPVTRDEPRGETGTFGDPLGGSPGTGAGGPGGPGVRLSRSGGTERRIDPETGEIISGSDRGAIFPGRRRGDIPIDDTGKPIEPSIGGIASEDTAGSEVAIYKPLSVKGRPSEYVVPARLSLEVEDAMRQIAEEVGDIDNFVASKLNYENPDMLGQYYFQAQVDAIAAGVFQIERGNAIIIGHQTGTGKGRIAAGIMRYAIENGKIPVFVTKGPELFTDIYRDMVRTGSGHYKPYLINTTTPDGKKVKIYHPDTFEPVYEADLEMNKIVIGTPSKLGTHVLPEGYNMVMVSYSQFTTEKRDEHRREFLMSLARNKDVVFIMDESHYASGTSNTGEFFLDWLNATSGGMFLSATYAKRPDNMPLYIAKTFMMEANDTFENLVESIKRGGPALQEFVTKQLAETGQFTKIGFRMDAEMNYLILGDSDPAQRTFNPELGKEIVKKFDQVTSVLRDIVRFQKDYVNPIIQNMDDGVKAEGKGVSERKGTTEAGVYNSPYFSRVWNVLDQLMLALKVDHIADMVIDDLKAGKKPVIALRSTMEAMFKDMEEEGLIERNMQVKLDFTEVFMRAMRTVMKYTVKDEKGIPGKFSLEPTDLTPAGKAEYYKLVDKIKAMSTGITISPIDVLKKKITDAGFKALEITGRNTMLELNEDMSRGVYKTNDRLARIDAVRMFNNNPGYAIIYNVAGSVGVSFHSSGDFKDLSQRIYYGAQSDLDINTEIQKLGRIYRADQVNKPAYNFITSPVPAEMRMFMMTAKKLKSLDANTSGNQRHSKSMLNFPDFLNKYGDEAVFRYLEENPDLNEMLGDPLSINSREPNKENAAHRVTGKIQIMPSQVQEEFYKEVIEAYENDIEYLNATGTNDLMVTTENFEAEVKSSEVTIAGRGGYSAFGDDTILNTVEVNILRRPLTKKQLLESIEGVLQGKTPEEYQREIIRQIEEGMESIGRDQIDTIRAEYEAKRIDWEKRIIGEGKGTEEDVRRAISEKMETLIEHEEYRVGVVSANVEKNKLAFIRYARYFYPGRVVEVPFHSDEQLDLIRMNKGIFLGFDIKTNKRNPWIPSNFTLKFATTDSRRVFSVPASKEAHISSIINNSYGLTKQEGSRIMENWDSMTPNRLREARFIVTGNILQGMNMYRGRLVEFTMKDGSVNKGILMPENWIKPDNNIARVPVTQTFNIIRALHVGDFVEDMTGDIIIKKITPIGGIQLYKIRVPESTKRGARYYTNQELKGLVNDGFWEKNGDRMDAVFPETNLLPVLQVLESRFKTVMEVSSYHVQKSADQTDASAMMDKYGSKNTPRRKDRGGLSDPADEVLGAGSKRAGKRIPVAPITGEKGKRPQEIMLSISTKIGQKPMYSRSPHGRKKGVAGTFNPGTGHILLKYQGDMDILAHELGHYLDMDFGLLGVEAQAIWQDLKNDLQDLWEFGSKPPKGSQDPELYQMKEGMAEFLRALVVNPVETKRRYPLTYNWVRGRIEGQDPEAWKAIEDFSKDVRVYWGQSNLDIIGSRLQLEQEPKDRKYHWMRTNKHGQFQWTYWDKFAAKWFDDLDPIITTWRWAMETAKINYKDPRILPPSKNLEIMLSLMNGFNIKMQNVYGRGMATFDGTRIIHSKTGRPLSLALLFEQIPSHNYNDHRKNLELAMNVGLSQRVVEIPSVLQARYVESVLAAKADKLPPLSVLKKQPYRAAKYNAKIQRILKQITDGELDKNDVFLPEEDFDFTNANILGVHHPEGLVDYTIAVKALAEFDALQKANPGQYDWVEDFLDVYRDMNEALIDYMMDSGMLLAESALQIKSEHLSYFALRRFVSAFSPDDIVEGKDISDSLLIMSDGALGIKPQLYPVKGSEKIVKNPLMVLIEAMYRTMYAGDINYVVASYANAFLWHQNESVRPIRKTGEIAYVTDVPEPNSINFFVKGKKKYIVFRDELVSAAWKKLLMPNAKEQNIVWQLLTLPPRLLRTLIVTSVKFILRNPVRDLGNFLVVGVHKKSMRPQDFWFNKEMRDKMEIAGIGQFGYVVVRKEVAQQLMYEYMLNSIKDPRKYIFNPYHYARKGFKWAIEMARSSEMVVRMLQAKAAYRYARNVLKLSDFEASLYAAHWSRNLLDFMRGGTYAKHINQAVLFFNPFMKGMEKIYTATRDRPTSTGAGFFAAAVLPAVANSVFIYMTQDDDIIDEYLNLPAYVRDSFYVIPVSGGRFMIIPKPFELGYFASMFQRYTDMILLGDKRAFSSDWANNLLNMANPFDMAGIMGGYQGITRSFGGYDYFRDRPTIPYYEQEISIAGRNTDYASKLGKTVQLASDAVTRMDADYLVDARKVDAFFEGFFGDYGSLMLKLVEKMGPERAFGKNWDTSPKFKFDGSLLGYSKRFAVYDAPDVQWLLKHYKAHPEMKNTEDYTMFMAMIRMYFSEEIQNDPEKERTLRKTIRRTATATRDNLDPVNFYKRDELMKKAKQAERGK